MNPVDAALGVVMSVVVVGVVVHAWVTTTDRRR